MGKEKRKEELGNGDRAAIFSGALKKLLPYTVIALLLAGNFNSLVQGKDFWPFSHYPMFSKRPSVPYVSWLRLYAHYEGDDREVMLTSHEDTLPLSSTYFSRIVMRLRQDRDQDRLNRLMRSVLNIQNSKKHDRKIKELKLYVVEWNYPQENFDPKSPDRRYLVSHVVAD